MYQVLVKWDDGKFDDSALFRTKEECFAWLLGQLNHFEDVEQIFLVSKEKRIELWPLGELSLHLFLEALRPSTVVQPPPYLDEPRKQIQEKLKEIDNG